MSIPQEIIEEVRRRTSLIDLIGNLQNVRRAGRSVMACCPFHNEKTPSFSINEEDGLYHCFGCGKKGNVFHYVMETRQLNFAEAVRFLANRLGITIVENNDERQERKFVEEKKRKILYGEILALAVNIYREHLFDIQKSRLAQEYLVNRKISREMIDFFKLGYAPDSFEFIFKQISQKIDKSKIKSDEELLRILFELGLVKIKALQEKRELLKNQNIEESDEEEKLSPEALEILKSARSYDAYRNRIIFPIMRSDNVPIGLGGRIITDTKQAKYINSPENIIYHKSEVLYGLATGLKAIKDTGIAILVEGYFDVISMFQCGIENVVASCGTSVTPEHVEQLKRRVNGRVVALFDADVAGQKAAANCFKLFLGSGISVSTVALPEGEDPDSFAKANSRFTVEKYLQEKSEPIVNAYLEHLLSTQNGNLVRAEEEFCKAILEVKNAAEIEFLTRAASGKFGVSFENVTKDLERIRIEEQERLNQQNKFANKISGKRSLESHRRNDASGFNSQNNNEFSDYDAEYLNSLGVFDNIIVVNNKKINTFDDKMAMLADEMFLAMLVRPRLVDELLAKEKLSSDISLYDLFSLKYKQIIDIFAKGEVGGVGEVECDAKMNELLFRFGLPADNLILNARIYLNSANENIGHAVDDFHRSVQRLIYEREYELLVAEIKQMQGVDDMVKAKKIKQQRELKNQIHAMRCNI